MNASNYLSNELQKDENEQVAENNNMENSVDLVKHEDHASSSALGVSMVNTLSPFNQKQENVTISPYKIRHIKDPNKTNPLLNDTMKTGEHFMTIKPNENSIKKFQEQYACSQKKCLINGSIEQHIKNRSPFARSQHDSQVNPHYSSSIREKINDRIQADKDSFCDNSSQSPFQSRQFNNQYTTKTSEIYGL